MKKDGDKHVDENGNVLRVGESAEAYFKRQSMAEHKKKGASSGYGLSLVNSSIQSVLSRQSLDSVSEVHEYGDGSDEDDDEEEEREEEEEEEEDHDTEEQEKRDDSGDRQVDQGERKGDGNAEESDAQDGVDEGKCVAQKGGEGGAK